VLSRTDFTIDGAIDRQTSGPCPPIHQLSGTGAASLGIVMRGTETLRLPINPEIIFTGDRADKVTAAAVYEADRPDQQLMSFDLADRRATLRAAMTPLIANKRYVLKVTIENQSDPIAATFVAVAPTGDGSLVVLRVD